MMGRGQGHTTPPRNGDRLLVDRFQPFLLDNHLPSTFVSDIKAIVLIDT